MYRTYLRKNGSIVMVILCVILNVFSGIGQEKDIQWINENAHAINLKNTTNTDDLSFLKTELKDNMLFGLGEASHGTKEFYLQKRRIIEYLVTKLNYKRIGFEFQEPSLNPINQYLQDGKGDLKALMKETYLYNTEEIYGLFQWIKEYNAKQKTATDKVILYGFDDAEFAGDPFNRDRFMADKIIKKHTVDPNKTILWAHNVHIAKDTTMAQYRGMGWYLREQYKDNFYVLGFDTYKGSVSVLDGENAQFEKHDFEAKPNSLTSIFATAKSPAFFISFRSKSNPFFGKEKDITNIFANWGGRRSLPIRPGFDFDGLIFIKETTGSTQLK